MTCNCKTNKDETAARRRTAQARARTHFDRCSPKHAPESLRTQFLGRYELRGVENANEAQTENTPRGGSIVIAMRPPDTQEFCAVLKVLATLRDLPRFQKHEDGYDMSQKCRVAEQHRHDTRLWSTSYCPNGALVH